MFVILIVTYHHGTAGSQFARGRDAILIWNVSANILNKQSLTADKG